MIELFTRPYYEKHEHAKKVCMQVLKEIDQKTYKLSGNNLVIDCPVCGKEKHLYVSLIHVRGLFICFRCQLRGKLDQDIVLPNPTYNRKELFVPDTKPVYGSKPEEGFYTEEAYNYLHEKRKIDEDKIKQLRPFVRRGEKRVFFPVYDYGKIVYAVGRLFDPYGLRYLDIGNKTIFTVPWNNYEKRIVVVEGVFDAIATPDGLALCGKYMSYYQEFKFHELIENLNTEPEIVVCLDADAFEKTYLMYTRLGLYYKNVKALKLQEKLKDPEQARDLMPNFLEQLSKLSPGVYFGKETGEVESWLL